MLYSHKIPIKTARFANVAFSNGSLLDGFTKRLENYQPLAAAIDIKRYFVSPEESGQICLLACILGQSGQIFFPKLGDHQMKFFSNIASDFLKEFGFNVQITKTEKEAKEFSKEIIHKKGIYPVYFFESDTSGEKTFEEFYDSNETVDFKKFKSLGVIDYKRFLKKDLILDVLNDLNNIFKADSFNKADIF